MKKACWLVFLWLWIGCGNKGIEDGHTVNNVQTIATGYVSAFVFEPSGHDGFVLFDTGSSAEGEDLLAGLEKLGATANDITHIFISHGHNDHIGGIDLFPNAQLHGFAEDKDLIKQKASRDLDYDVSLTDGDIIAIGEDRIETFHVPGHTPGNAVFLVNGILLFGDTAIANQDDTIGPPPEFFSADPEKAEKSLKDFWTRIEPRQDEIEWMFFSHSGPVQGVAALKSFAEK